MPKLVDHAERRQQIVDATWRIIAERGFAATTTRDISSELGMALGAIHHYFPTKDALLLASYEHVFVRTAARFEARVGDLRGVAALRIFVEEISPLGSEQLLEARVVLPFWERCATSPAFAEVNERGLAGLLETMATCMDEAVADGEISPEIERDTFIRGLFSFVSGLQVLAILFPERYDPRTIADLIDAQFAPLVRMPAPTRAL